MTKKHNTKVGILETHSQIYTPAQCKQDPNCPPPEKNKQVNK